MTHLRSAKLTHPSHRAAAAKAQQGKALSSPPSGWRWVIWGEQSRVKFRERRGADVFRMYNPLMELYLYGIGTGILLPVMAACYFGVIRLLKDADDDVLVLLCLSLVFLVHITPLSIFVTVRFISLCVSRYA